MDIDDVNPYRESYAIIIDAHSLTKEQHDSLQEFITLTINMINGFTPFEAYHDDDYSDPITPTE